tara:strand:- start:347 stop:556 length:210 start_codon:yes stop_codon:yes gene_type:complete
LQDDQNDVLNQGVHAAPVYLIETRSHQDIQISLLILEQVVPLQIHDNITQTARIGQGIERKLKNQNTYT